MGAQNHYIYEFGPFRLDATMRVLLKEGEPVKLFPKQFDTLLALVERGGEVLDKQELMRQVWRDSIVEESNLTTNISHLRKLLGESRDRHDYIVTVPGRGYRFVASVRQTFDEVIVRERTRAELTVEEEEEAGAPDADSPGCGLRVAGCRAATLSSSDPQPDGGELFVGAAPVAVVRPISSSLPATMAPTASAKSRRAGFRLGVAVALVAASVPAFILYRLLSGDARPAPFQNVALKQLTADGKANIAALSPDGKLFAYVSGRGAKQSLWLGHMSGGEPIELRRPAEVTYRAVDFSPDGASLYYVVSGGENPRGALFRAPVFGGVPEKLRENINAKIAFSPDMERFAYTRSDGERKVSSLVVADTFGAAERELVSRPEHLPFRSFSPSWSPDGAKIAVSAVTDGGGKSWEVFVVSVADGNIEPLTALAWSQVKATVWLPDMSGLMAVAGEKGSWDCAQLWHVSYPGGVARRILPDLNNYGSSISLTSDGSMLTAVQDQKISNVWVAPADDLSRAVQITYGSVGRRDGWTNLDWTPDGKLLYGAFVRDSLTIWAMDANGGNQRQLTSEGHRDAALSATDDGRYVVFESNRGGGTEVWRARLDGGELRQLTSGGNNEEPHVSPDGSVVVFTSLRDGLRTLWRISLEGGEPVRLADKPAYAPRVSPDGKLVACAYAAPLDPPRTQLAVLPVEGGQPLKLFDVPRLANFNYGIRWTPDGTALTYRDWANGIWRQPLDRGEPRRLAGLPEEKIYAYGWSRDGRQFAFVRGAELRDVVLLRNLK